MKIEKQIQNGKSTMNHIKSEIELISKFVKNKRNFENYELINKLMYINEKKYLLLGFIKGARDLDAITTGAYLNCLSIIISEFEYLENFIKKNN